MFYLYLKTHNKTGLKYLGMTTKDPFKYKGSGLRWKRHIAEHGADITTQILRECSTNEELSTWGVYYSELWKVVESNEFANLVPEDGLNSCGMKGKTQTIETRNKISSSLRGHAVSDKVRETSRKTLLGKEPWNKGKSGEYSVHGEDEKKRRSEEMKGYNNPFFGKSHSEEFKNKQREAQKKKVECPYCNKIGASRIMARWHFDNCKENDGK